MYKFLLLLTLMVATMLAGTNAAVAMGFFKDPAYPGKCAISENLILSEGDIVKDPEQTCGRIICGKEGIANFQTCGVQQLMDGCEFGDYLHADKLYPDCCEREKICN